MKTAGSGDGDGDGVMTDQRKAATAVSGGSECNENVNHLGGSSGSNRDIDLYSSRTMPGESCNSAYVHVATSSTTDVSRRNNSSIFSSNFRQHKNWHQYGTSKSTTMPHSNTQPLRSFNQFSSGYRSTTDLTCGPRGQGRKSDSNLPSDKKMWHSVRREDYNQEDFQTKYYNAKFYVIKPISEDDLHKCIKYNVWSSTPYGNRKLDAAFRDTQDETSEADTVCPIFLFYSVNKSGQFAGLAEMIGKVDFAKNLNFWQTENWNGFFPVKWHIIKDIPHSKLRHIIIENNDNEPVTRTKDTQEVGFQHGLEMLKIFKSYTANTSLLDDFNFYENREQSLRAKRSSMPATQTEKHERAGDRTSRGFTTNNFSGFTDPIIRRTQKLSIHVTRH